jgi:predicted RNA-binding Zn-ribbon protein involved in translation (DUF1610 family)
MSRRKLFTFIILQQPLKRESSALVFMVETKCASTKQNISNDVGSVSFPCPSCGKKIIRSKNARQNVVKYTCGCGFVGP